MDSFFIKRKKIKKSSSGQALLEYTLILAISAGLSVSIYKVFNDLIRKGILKYNAVLELNLRTGELGSPPTKSVWEN